jgi:2-methylaconitate cis-trans-isomerase PrpF
MKEAGMAKSKKSSVALGSIVDNSRIKVGAPPVILQAQAYGYIPLETPEQLKQWQEDLRTFHGISLDASRLAGIAAETCSAGCSDACDMIQ